MQPVWAVDRCLLAVLSFVPAMADLARDDVTVWAELLRKLKVMESVKEQLEASGFKLASTLYWSLKEESEQSLKSLPEKAGVEQGSAPTLLSTVEAGKLRRLLAECRGMCEQGEDDSGSVWLWSLPPSPETCSAWTLVKVDAAKLRQLWVDFDNEYPCEQLECDSRPAKQLTQQIYGQKHAKEQRFIPWKQIVSEV